MGKRKKCPGCGAPFKRGFAILLVVDAEPEPRIVCGACRRRAVVLGHAVTGGDRVRACEECKRAAARFCGGCVAKQLARGATKAAKPGEWS